MKGRPHTYFDSHCDDYAEQIMATQPVFYQNAGRLLNAALRPGDTVLDIGNGGVINYEYRTLNRLDCVDLVVSAQAVQKYREVPNVRFFQADALTLDGIAEESYDAVMMQAVIHHLAGKTRAESCVRVSAAVASCLRVLKPGGRLLVVESTVSPWFERVERAAYPLMQLFFALCRFGRVYQFSPPSLLSLMKNVQGGRVLHWEPVDVGPRIWIMGHGIPTHLTPCGVTYYVLEKSSAPAERSFS